jgi:Fe2+ or Zn2+ uptake regulation protein
MGTSRTAPNGRLPDGVWERLRQAGLRVTPLRRRLVRLLAAAGRWYTPEEFGQAARRAGLHPGRATVYRLFGALLAAGLCRSFPQANRVTRYVFCAPGHHHHLICLDCGSVTTVTDCTVRTPDRSFAVLEHVVDFFGRCARCQKRIGPPPRLAASTRAHGDRRLG